MNRTRAPQPGNIEHRTPNTEHRTSFPREPRAQSQVIRTFMVDDSPVMLVLLARMLAKNERILIVGSVTDSQKAFRSALMSHADLVLIDLHMPGIDGVEITRWLKQLQDPPIVFVVTSDDTPQAEMRSLRAGADAFLIKAPDLPARLGEAIENFFGDNVAEKNAVIFQASKS